MEIIKKLIGMLTGKGGLGNQSQLLGAAMGMLGGGGLGGLLGKFQSAGLGSKFDSFVGSGENESLRGRDVRKVLGDDEIAQIAEQAGMSKRQATKGLAALLPKAVDQLTPEGKIPDEDSVDVDALRSRLGL